MIFGHGGNKTTLSQALGCPVDDIIDMSANLNPLGPPEQIKTVMMENLSAIHCLPEPDARSMTQGFARFHDIDPDTVIAGNGTTWFIYTIPRALNAKKALVLGPTYSDYADACRMHGTATAHWIADAEDKFLPDLEAVSQMAAQADLVFICNPNNPTGVLVEQAFITELLQRHPRVCFVVDESYLPFAADGDEISLIRAGKFPNLLVLSSMSKIFTIPGLRTGFLSGAKPLIDRVMAYYQPWSVNALAQVVIKNIFDHPELIAPFYEKTRSYITREKQIFIDEVADLPALVTVLSHTCFILAELLHHTAFQVCRQVGFDRILIRDCSNFKGLDHRFVRFSLKDRETNLKLAASLRKVLAHD
ncbi:MAG: pyridoxal phosphate-dependent class II aminotransferase [Desulfotignum sp.]|nr:pyridoxal phosphate-dependent class II aminotransferase [Desulfotignum sp.]MCF8112551.1 pyridoxal phosphate-dependent class II aminotransferase [Desulfotignum sp.]